MTFIIKVMGAHPYSVSVPAKTSQGFHQELLDLRRPDLDQHPTTWRTRVSGRVPADLVIVKLVTLFSKRLQIGVPGQVGGTAVHLVTGPTPCQCVCNCNWVRFIRKGFCRIHSIWVLVMKFYGKRYTFFHIFKLFFRFCVICFNDKMVSYTETYFQLI